MNDTELFILDRIMRYPYSYYEIAYVLNLIKSKWMVDEVIKLSREKKICVVIMAQILSKKWGIRCQ